MDGKPGYWGITHRGGQFLKGEIFVPLNVKTFRNKIVDHGPERTRVQDVMREDLSFFEQIPDFDVMHPEAQLVERKQLTLA